MLGFGIAFSPLVPDAVLWAAVAVAGAIVILLFVGRTRGAAVRALALALMVAALANPSLTREDRDPLTSVAVVVVDKSPSQDFGERTAQTAAARAALVTRLQRVPGLELRVVEAGQAGGETDGTRLFPRPPALRQPRPPPTSPPAASSWWRRRASASSASSRRCRSASRIPARPRAG